MRQVVIVGGVLGGGSALVFAVAALVATLFPTGSLVPSSWNGGFGRAMPAIGGAKVWIDGTDGGVLVNPIPIEPQVDPGIEAVPPPDITNPGEVVR